MPDVVERPPFGWLCHYYDSYASLLIASGASVKTVQARLGHRSAVEALNTYADLWPDSEDQTRRAVDSALGHLGLSSGAVGAVEVVALRDTASDKK